VGLRRIGFAEKPQIPVSGLQGRPVAPEEFGAGIYRTIRPMPLKTGAGMAHIPGAHAATLLFDKGLWFDAVVRGLITELGLSEDQAFDAATAAAATRFASGVPESERAR
jgi:hypothetical protein